MHVEIANPGWWGKRSRHSWRMCNPKFCVSVKKPIETVSCIMQWAALLNNLTFSLASDPGMHNFVLHLQKNVSIIEAKIKGLLFRRLSLIIQSNFHWSLFTETQITSQNRFRQLCRVEQAMNHYLNQLWSSLLTHIRVAWSPCVSRCYVRSK